MPTTDAPPTPSAASREDEPGVLVRRAGRPPADRHERTVQDWLQARPEPRGPEAAPLTLAINGTLVDEPEAGLSLLVRALRNALQPHGPEDPDVAEAIDAFLFFVAETGRDSCNRYDSWRGGHPLKALLPSSKTLRELLGGPERRWEVVKERCQTKPGYSPSALRLTQAHSPVQLDEVLVPLAHWCGITEGWLRMQDFLDWYAADLAENPGRWPRPVPLTKDAFRKFGGWAACLARVGHAGRQALHRRLPTRPAVSPEPEPEFTTQEIATTLSNAWHALGVERWLSAEDFDRWIGGQRATLRRQGLSARLPDSSDARRVFGSWPQALVQTGLASAEDAEHVGQGQRLATDELYEAFAQALLEEGPRLSPNGYQARRQRLVAAAAQRGEVLRLPSEGILRRRLAQGSWPRARALTLLWMKARGTVPEGYRMPVILVKAEA